MKWHRARSALKRGSSTAPKMRMIDSAAGRRQTRKEGSFPRRSTTSIYPVLNTYRIVVGIDRLAFQPLLVPRHSPMLDRDDTRVSEIMKFRRCRSNARRRSGDLSSSPHLQRHVFRPFLPHRRPPFSFFRSFSLFCFLSFLAARYTCRPPSNVRRQLNIRRSDVIFERYRRESRSRR